MKLTDREIERIRNGELASVIVSPEYFRNGDYTRWQDQAEETSAMPYEEYVDWLVKEMGEKYDTIVLYSDGTMYGNRGGISHDISYQEFSSGDYDTFIALVEKFGIGNIEFS